MVRASFVYAASNDAILFPTNQRSPMASRSSPIGGAPRPPFNFFHNEEGCEIRRIFSSSNIWTKMTTKIFHEIPDVCAEEICGKHNNS